MADVGAEPADPPGHRHRTAQTDHKSRVVPPTGEELSPNRVTDRRSDSPSVDAQKQNTKTNQEKQH